MPTAMASAHEPHLNGSNNDSKLTAQDQEDVQAINAAVDRMRAILPSDPYVLTIPQTVEPRYHHQSAAHARAWLVQAPFDYKEHENTQYQTFVYHEPGKDMYELHSTRPAEAELNGGASVRGLKEKGGTGANTPAAAQAPKKTYSLNAYKKKQAGGSPDVSSTKEADQSVKKPAVKGPIERIKADEEVLAAVEDDDNILPLSSQEKEKDLKRKREDDPSGRGKEEATTNGTVQEAKKEERPLKKPRKVPPQEEAGPKQDAQPNEAKAQSSNSPTKSSSTAQEVAETMALPPRLSPPQSSAAESTLPPRLSPIDDQSLPARLSPTIPTNIATTLEARTHYRSASRSSNVSAPGSTSKDADKLTPPPSQLEKSLKKHKSPVPRNGFRANSSSPAVRSDVEDRGRPTTSMPPRPRSPELDFQDSDEIPVGKMAAKAKKQRDSAKSSLVVKLKFKKAQKEAVRRILKLRPSPIREPTDQSKEKKSSKSSDQRHRERRDTNAKGVAQKVGPTSASNGASKKRPRTEDTDNEEEPQSKRKRAPSDANELKRPEPSTPGQPELLSPSTAQRPNSQLTPTTMRKDVLSAAMKRELSNDSNVRTPSAITQSSPPPSASHNSQQRNGTLNAASHQPSTKTPKQQAWESERKRLDALGRSLKYAVSDHQKSASSMPPSDADGLQKEQKLAAIKSIESLLAYILAFICFDEAALNADPKSNPSVEPWRTLHGFFGFVKKNCEPVPNLQGLACWLSMVCYQHILALWADHPSEALSRDAILEMQAMMQRYASDADSKLDIDALQDSFPKTWEGRTKGEIASQSLEVGKSYAGQYKLPIGVQTSPLRAVRAGFAMLEEWVAKEGGEEFYVPKLKL